MKLRYLQPIVVGGWQLAEGHSATAQAEGLRVLEAYYAAGFRTFDCADIYTGVEALLGSFIRAHGLGPNDVRVHTKYVPDMAALSALTPAQTEAVIDRSRTRLGREALDLVQFHWWHLPTGDYLAALHTLSALRDAGKVREIGLTNFGAAQVKDILAEGIPVAAMQVQYSVLDRRPATALAPLLGANGVALLCYGSVAGGLLSERYLGVPAPREPVENRSLVKYLLVAAELGGWPALQAVLECLRAIADARGADIASVASAWCLAQPGVRACIIGVRSVKHTSAHLRLARGLRLSPEDVAQIDAVRQQFPPVPGGVYDLERDVSGKHGRVMKYDLGTR